jgi:hypothetical protein
MPAHCPTNHLATRPSLYCGCFQRQICFLLNRWSTVSHQSYITVMATPEFDMVFDRISLRERTVSLDLCFIWSLSAHVSIRYFCCLSLQTQPIFHWFVELTLWLVEVKGGMDGTHLWQYQLYQVCFLQTGESFYEASFYGKCLWHNSGPKA